MTSPHLSFFHLLVKLPQLDRSVLADRLGRDYQQYVQRHWVVPSGHLTNVMVPFLDSEQEVEVDIDDDQKTYSYRSPSFPSRVVTRPLSLITLYALNLDSWMEEICDLLEIEPSRRARNRELIAGSLWHLGDIRVGTTHRHAPIYIARRLNSADEELRKTLLHPKRSSHGIVLISDDEELDLPNSHQTCGISRLLVDLGDGNSYDKELVQRLLKGTAADADDPEEFFNADTGELKLACIAEPRIFKGKQKDVIAMFWKARGLKSLKWSDVTAKTLCGKDPDSVFGREWSTWLVRIEGQRGYYRLRTKK